MTRSMPCPGCNVEMAALNFGPALVDVCSSGCGGMWFDWGELTRLDESHEGSGDVLQAILEHPWHDLDRPRPAQLACPKCSLPMRNHPYPHAPEVRVDECATCGGFFLDSGELRAIRDTYLANAARDGRAPGAGSPSPVASGARMLTRFSSLLGLRNRS